MAGIMDGISERNSTEQETAAMATTLFTEFQTWYRDGNRGRCATDDNGF